MISLPPQVLELTGADAIAFAQAQFCNDALTLADGDWQWNAWLSAQGRVRAFFRLQRKDATHLILTLRGGDADWMRRELARFVFRANVQMIAVTADVEPATLADIRAGLPEIGADLRDQLLPQWIGLDRLGAVSVRKGCYPGQEIMARLHFKGGNKRSLYRIGGDARITTAAMLRDAQTGEEAGCVLQCARADSGKYEALASLIDARGEATLRSDSGSTVVRVIEHFG
ncbi:MAG: folate-binding protein [Proteobacteria bacterium]|nr:folate-binding protein [Pseudomonadota bacterium]